jgi:pimeloyl-ACP methyl ester carboxylesterase
VLDGPVAPNRAVWFNKPADFVDNLERLSAACAAQPACNDAFPNVAWTFWQAVDEFERTPKARAVTGSSGTSAMVTVDGSVLAAALAALLDREMYSIVPLAIHAMASGNEAVVNQLSQIVTSRPDADVTARGLGWGLHYAVNCFDQALLNTPHLRQRMRSDHPAVLIDKGVFPDPTLCDGLHTFRAGPEDVVPTESEIPTLIFTGEFDMQTHRSNGEMVARSLKRSQLVEIPGAGHVQSWRHECTRAVMRDFYNRPLQPVDTRCLKSMPPLHFATDLKAMAK